MELVSIVIPVYNVEAYLGDCIESVINQTYQNIEIILVDDGSTDGSPQLCDKYAENDSRIKVIHQMNSGPSAARNTGIACAEGKYLCFLDSDDYIVPNAIQILTETIEKENSDIITFDAETILDDSATELPVLKYERKKAYGSSQGTEMLLKLHMDGVLYTGVPFMFVNLEYIRRIGLTFYPGILHEDDLFTVVAYLNAKKVTHIHRALYIRRMRENSIMTVPFSQRHFLGYSTCIQKLIPYYLAAQEATDTRKFLDRFLRERMNWTVNGFAKLDTKEQVDLCDEFNALRLELKKCNYFGDKRTQFKMNHTKLWKIYLHLVNLGILKGR